MIHPTADVSPKAKVGAGTNLWNQVQVRKGAVIGAGCNIGKGVYIDRDVVIGDRVKIQNRVSIYWGTTIEDGAFVGPHACFPNDKYPRAIHRTGLPITEADWTPGRTLVKQGASIGVGAVVLPGVTLGCWAMIGAGALVTRDVPEHGLAIGSPAEVVGYVCYCARPLRRDPGGRVAWRCTVCHQAFRFEPFKRRGGRAPGR